MKHRKYHHKRKVQHHKKSDNTSQKKLGASQKAIVEMISENPNNTTSEIADRIGINHRNVQEHIK